MMGTEISEFIDSAYTWQERAIKAEAKFTECRKAAEVLQSEVERLQTLLEKYNAKCAVCDHVSEIMRLHKVVEAARDVVGFGVCHDENSLWSIKALQNTIENYEGWEKEGER